MKILETQSAHLTNYEVLTHLKSMRARYAAGTSQSGSRGMKSGNLETVMKEVMDYLYRRPSPLASQETYNENTIRSLFEALASYDLTKAELMMILNLRPMEITTLDTIIEEIDERLSEESQQGIVDAITRTLGQDDGEVRDRMVEDGSATEYPNEDQMTEENG